MKKQPWIILVFLFLFYGALQVLALCLPIAFLWIMFRLIVGGL